MDTLLGWVKKKKTKKYGNKSEVGPDTAKPIGIELGGRMGIQMNGILQGMTKFAEGRGKRAQRGDSTSEDEARHREDVAAR